jgi:hypothetical protein
MLARTVANGCTEEEALAFATKAREYQDKYRLTQSDLEIQHEPVIDDRIRRRNRKGVCAVDYCMSGIAKYCGIRMWFTNDGDVSYARVFGLRDDVEMAKYLYDMINTAILSENGTYWKKTLKPDPFMTNTMKRRAIWSFEVGMAGRINERLTEMARALDETAKTANGTALVVVKNPIVTKAFNELGIHLSRGRTGRSVADGASYSAGKEAGDRTNLNRPVGGFGERTRLGR